LLMKISAREAAISSKFGISKAGSEGAPNDGRAGTTPSTLKMVRFLVVPSQLPFPASHFRSSNQ
jgi:hypothetical protein